MGFFDNVLSGVSNLVGTAASVATAAATFCFPPVAIATSLGNLVTQGIGQALNAAVQTLTQVAGMPKFIAGEVSDLIGKVLNKLLQPSDQGCDQHVRDCCGNQYNNFIERFCGSIVENAIEEMKGGKGGTSWFEALAKALGKALDAQAAEVQKLSDAVQGQSAEDNPSGFTDLQAASQRMSFMMSAADQVLKTLGEGLATLARK
jgi:flagellar hook-basal body complex protein FliE